MDGSLSVGGMEREEVIRPNSCLRSVLRIPVFRLALGDSLIARIVMAVYNFFSGFCQHGVWFKSFDGAKAQASLDRFRELGGVVVKVKPEGEGEIQMLWFRASDLEQKIKELGGQWVKRDDTFVIEPPALFRGDAWNEFSALLCRHFHWEADAEGNIVTCRFANAVTDEAPRCFLYAHTTTSCFAAHAKRGAFYLGAKQDFVFFDPGNTWLNSGRPVSEQGFYQEIRAVYEQVKETYPANRLWVGGTCGGAPVAAFLKRELHEEGVHCFIEQSFPTLDGFIDQTAPFPTFFGPRVKGSLDEAGDNPDHSFQFNVERMWHDLNKGAGKVVLVEVREDENIPAEAYERYRELADKVSQSASRVLYTSNQEWHHADEFWRYEEPSRQFMQQVFA